MAFVSNGIRDAFEGQSEAGFVAWTYASYDSLEDILQPGYFQTFSRSPAWGLSAGRPA
jgi:hypothetical protein